MPRHQILAAVRLDGVPPGLTMHVTPFDLAVHRRLLIQLS